MPSIDILIFLTGYFILSNKEKKLSENMMFHLFIVEHNCW